MLARVALMMSSTGWNVEDKGWSFLLRNSLLRLAFLLRVEGLFLLTTSEAVTGAEFSRRLVAMEKLKVEPMVSEKVKDWPWLASVWQRAKHWEAKEALSSPTAVIFFSLLN